MAYGQYKPLSRHQTRQSMVDFPLILPLVVLLIVGVINRGRVFFAIIAIPNKAREGAHLASFLPDDPKINDRTTCLACFMHK
jgi:hypothetical protein